MTFGQILAVLLESTGVTRGRLAAHLGYDISYISRWVSDLKLPSVKNNSTLFRQIASCLVNNSNEEGRVALSSLLDMPGQSLGSDLEIRIVHALSEAYREEGGKGHKSSSETKLVTNCMLSQIELSLEKNSQLIIQCIAEAGERGDVEELEFFIMPQPAEINRNESKNFLTNIEKRLPAEKTIHVKLVIDIFEEQYRFSACREICVFFSGLPDRITVELYSNENCKDSQSSVFLCRDSICVLSYYDVLLLRINWLLIQDQYLLSQYHGSSDTFLRGKASLIHKDSFFHLYEQNFFQSFSMMDESLCSLHTVMPLMLVNGRQKECLAVNHHISPEALEIQHLYEKTVQTWSVMIYKSAVVEFLFSGRISIFGQIIVLTREERQEYLTRFLEKTANSRYELTILNDKNPLLNREDIDNTLFLSKRNLFFIRHSQSHQPGTIHYSNDISLTENFNDFWQGICALAPVYIMKDQAVAAFFEQGLKML